MILNIDNRNFSNLPFRLKKARIVEWLQFLSKPLRHIAKLLYSFGIDQKEFASISGQVVYLEYILNRYFYPGTFNPDDLTATPFNPNNNLIYISDASTFTDVNAIYQEEEENETLIMYNDDDPDAVPTIFYEEEEYEEWPAFIVNIPSGMPYDLNALKSLINRHKLASLNYQIQTY